MAADQRTYTVKDACPEYIHRRSSAVDALSSRALKGPLSILRILLPALLLAFTGLAYSAPAAAPLHKTTAEKTALAAAPKKEKDKASIRAASARGQHLLNQSGRTLPVFRNQQPVFAQGFFVSYFTFDCFRQSVAKEGFRFLSFEALLRKIIFPFHHFW